MKSVYIYVTGIFDRATKSCVFVLMLAVPYDGPEGFTATPGVREVNFSWSAPPTSDNRIVVIYTLSCSPSPSTLPRTLSQTGLRVAGFSPNTSYSCSVYIVDKNGLGSGPRSDTTFETLEDCKAGVQYNVYLNT